MIVLIDYKVGSKGNNFCPFGEFRAHAWQLDSEWAAFPAGINLLQLFDEKVVKYLSRRPFSVLGTKFCLEDLMTVST